MFLVAVGFWNFLGAGVFGFLINLPIVSYYEIGTALTANHGHAAMMGVYGMLAVGLALFCLRYLIPAERWPDRAAKIELLVAQHRPRLDVLRRRCCRSGFLQLYESVSSGYFDARDARSSSTNATNTLLEWLRFPGDVLFIAGGVLPLLYICWLGVRHRSSSETLEEPEDILFTEVPSPRRGSAAREHRAAPRRCSPPATRCSCCAAARDSSVLARHTHRRSSGFRTAASRSTAIWTPGSAPRASTFGRIELDHERAARALPRPRRTSVTPVPRKDDCTDSDEGREVIRHLDPWPHSEAGRFHRGIALVPVALAALVCVVSAIRHHGPAELLVAGCALALTGLEARYLLAAFRRSPAGFPVATSTPASVAPARRLARWASVRPDSRPDPYARASQEREEETVPPKPRH